MLRSPTPPEQIAAVLRRRGQLDTDERGSLIVVVSILMIVVLLSSLLFVRVIGNQSIVIDRQHTNAGVAGANAALSDALFQIDQNNYSSGGMVCANAINPSDLQCIVTASAQSPQLNGISYVARLQSSAISGQVWTVQAIGQASSGFKGAVQETLTRQSQFPFAIFGKTSLTFDGTKEGFGTFSPGPYSSSHFTLCGSTPTSPPCVYIGSDGSLTCTSSNSPGSMVSVFFNSGSTSKPCGQPYSEGTINYPVPDPSIPANAYNCPGKSMGTYYEVGDQVGFPTILPGTYLCQLPLSVVGNVSPDPSTTDSNPVKIYIMLSGSNNTSSTTFFNPSAGSQVNTTIAYSDMSGHPAVPSPSDTLPDPELFQIYSNSVGNLTTNGNNGFVFGGTIDAPEASLIGNGCKSYYFGAVVINTNTCHGSPNLGFYYDSALSQDWGPWTITGYQQIAPSSVSIP